MAALVSGGVFVGAEGSARLLDLYRIFPAWDLPSHALSGIALGCALLWLFLRAGARRPATLAFVAATVLGGLWERVEQWDETRSPDPPHLRDTFFWDGFWDVLVTAVAAGLVAWWLAGGRRR